jgi:glucosamine-6-phosphate deaminase
MMPWRRAGQRRSAYQEMTTGDNCSLTVVPDAAAMSALAADIVVEVIAARPDAVISLPTGSTPLGMFDVLAARAARGEVDFGRIHLFCLDEYVGVTPDDPNSLTGWLQKALIDRIGLDPRRVHALPATAADLDAAAAEYERTLAALGGLDLAVLGLGPNGHIAYNEPGSAADSRTRVVALTPESREQARAYWEGDVAVPDRAITVGVGTLLAAKRVVLIVSGETKAEMLRRSLEDPMNAEVPASWLRLAGPRLHVIADAAAASALDTGEREVRLPVLERD